MPEKFLSSKQMLKQCADNHYLQAYLAKQKGEPVGWATSIFPQEFCEAMGLHVVFPENFAAIVSARHGAQPFLDIAEQIGYDVDLCAYTKVVMGYAAEPSGDVPLPLPDFVCCCNNICNTVLKWFENAAAEFNVPFILIDVPYNHDYEPTPHAIAYIRAQFDKCIRQLEEIAGRSFDDQRFAEVMRLSHQTALLWKEAIDLAAYVPAPLNGFDFFSFMALMVDARGKQSTIDVLERLLEELKTKVESGEACFPEGEKYRLMWDGIACWPYVGQNLRSFKEKGINIVYSSYPDAWTILYEPGNLDQLARAYTMTGNNSCMECQADFRTQAIRKFQVEGMLFHINRSCKIMDFLQYEQHRMITRRTGMPLATFDGDQADPRNFSPAQFETRLQTLMEMMEQKKSSESQ